MKRLSIRLSVVGAIIALGGFALFQSMRANSSAAGNEEQTVEGDQKEPEVTAPIEPPAGNGSSPTQPSPGDYKPGDYSSAQASFTTSSDETTSNGAAKPSQEKGAGGSSTTTPSGGIPQPGFGSRYSMSDTDKKNDDAKKTLGGTSGDPKSAAGGGGYSISDTQDAVPIKPAVQETTEPTTGVPTPVKTVEGKSSASLSDSSTLPRRLLSDSSTSTTATTGSAGAESASDKTAASPDSKAAEQSAASATAPKSGQGTSSYGGSAGTVGDGGGGYRYGGAQSGTGSTKSGSPNANVGEGDTGYRGSTGGSSTYGGTQGTSGYGGSAGGDGSQTGNPAAATTGAAGDQSQSAINPSQVAPAAPTYGAKGGGASAATGDAGSRYGTGSSSSANVGGSTPPAYGGGNPAATGSSTGTGTTGSAANGTTNSGYSAQGYSTGQSNGGGATSGQVDGSRTGSTGGTGYAPPAVVGAYGQNSAQATPGDAALEGVQQPRVTIEKQAPPELQVNRSSEFVTIVRNTGRVAANNVVITDRVPQGTRLVSTSPSAQQLADGRLAWSLGSLEPGRQEKLTMTLMPTQEGSIGSVATVTFQARASVKTVCTQPRLSVKQTIRPQVMIGDNVRIDISVSNPGTGDATGVVLEDDVPTGMTHPAGKALEYDIGTIRPGETKRLSLVLKAVSAGRMSNRLLVRGAGSLKSESAAPVEVIAPQLQLQVTGPRRRYLNRPARLNMTVSNPGTAIAKNVDLEMRLPKGLKFVSAGNQGEYNARDHAVYWSLAELRPGDKGVVQISLVPESRGTQVVKLAGRASNNVSQTSQYTMNVEALPEVVFTVSDTLDPVELGADTVYEIELQNRGSRAATQVAMVVDLPPGMTPSAQQPSFGPRARIEGQRLRFPMIPQLAPGQKVRYKVSAKGTQGGDHIVRVQVVSGEVSKPVTKEESTTVYSDSP